MKALTERDRLVQQIDLLRLQKDVDLEALKMQFRTTQESLNPLNLIKNSFKGVVANTSTADLLEGAAGLAGTYLTNKFIPNSVKGPITKIGGGILKFLGKKIFGSKS